VIKGALDNPVQLAEPAASAPVVTRVNAPPPPKPVVVTPSKAAPPPPPPPVASSKPPPFVKPSGEPAAIAASKIAAPAADSFDKYDAQSKNGGGGDTVAPIRELALSIQDLRPTDEELNSDSFYEAIRVAEEQEKTKAAAAAAPASRTDGVFDQAMLADLRGSIAPSQFDDLIRGLFEKTDEIVVALDKAAADGDQKAMTARAHELKGMAANFGLKELSGMAAEAEKALKENRMSGVPELLAALPAANQRAKDVLHSWMESSPRKAHA
jgi:HPt (histidine-containing phosphotransfer) domain-containing protein